MNLQSETRAAPTRRARRRVETIDEIKTLARRQLAEQGPGGLSLRAIARDMGTAPSALYRYFRNSSDLISALCTEAYDSVAAALAAARDEAQGKDQAKRFFAVCLAYRDWSLRNPSEFALIFGTPVPGYQPNQAVIEAAARFTAVGVELFADAVRHRAADPRATQFPPGLRAGDLWQALVGTGESSSDGSIAGIALSAWSSLLGYLVAEIFGSLPQLIENTDELYRAHVRTVMLGMGFDHAGSVF